MTGWTPRRFWKETLVVPDGGGWGIMLDARPLRTPAKAPLIVPSAALAQAIAAEWEAQGPQVRPAMMPLTRMANSAIDKVAPQFDAVVDEIAGYGGTDLLCYRAHAPEGLVARQAQVWDPLLDWARADLGVQLRVTVGVVPVAQPAADLARLRQGVQALDPFRLAGLHDLVAISGSLIIGMAVARGRHDPAEGFALSRIDERWQAELWGEDEDDVAAEIEKQAGFELAARLISLCG